MPLFESLNHIYKHPWGGIFKPAQYYYISLASWRKYPSPQRPDVLSVDFLSRELDPETGVLTTRRLITCKGQGPGWLKSMIGASYFYFLEETTVDPRTMKMVLASSNVSFSEIIKVEEVCTYTPHPENNKWTHFNQTAKFTAFPFGIKGSIESVCMDKFKKNAEKGREIMEQAILTLNQERKRLADEVDRLIESPQKTLENLGNGNLSHRHLT